MKVSNFFYRELFQRLGRDHLSREITVFSARKMMFNHIVKDEDMTNCKEYRFQRNLEEHYGHDILSG